MPPSKPRVTESGLLAESFGRRPHTVTLREEKEPGSNVILDFTSAEGRMKPSLGYPVRTGTGRRMAWDWDKLEQARQAAEDKAATLRLGQLRKETTEDRMTVGSAFALYHDPDRGGVRGAKSTISSHRDARAKWEAWLGKDTPWNSVTEADVEGMLQKYRDRGMIPTAVNCLQKLRACFNWLRKKKKLKHLDDPTESIELREVSAGHRANRPRYSPEEAKQIVAVRDRVDPRFALMVALMDDSGARREALRRTWRSDINHPLDYDPGEQAPYGWILLPSLKQQERPTAYLTAFQRREIDRALSGYLKNLERLYQEHGTDYPLFPSARCGAMNEPTIRVTPGRDKDGVWRAAQRNAYTPISATSTNTWMRNAEKLAGVPHVYWRAWHGLRRAVSDYLEEETDLATLTTALGWSSQNVPEQIYLEKGKSTKRGRARDAMEKKRVRNTDL